jgi:hypothetical protein
MIQPAASSLAVDVVQPADNKINVAQVAPATADLQSGLMRIDGISKVASILPREGAVGEAEPELGWPGSSQRRRRFSTPDRPHCAILFLWSLFPHMFLALGVLFPAVRGKTGQRLAGLYVTALEVDRIRVTSEYKYSLIVFAYLNFVKRPPVGTLPSACPYSRRPRCFLSLKVD